MSGGTKNDLLLEIVTPEKKLVSQRVHMVSVKGAEGELGILPQHVPLVTPLRIGPVLVKTENAKTEVYAVHGGFLEVNGDRVVILAESAELPEQIDANRAQRAKTRAEQRLQQTKTEQLDYARAERALARALLRMDVSQAQR